MIDEKNSIYVGCRYNLVFIADAFLVIFYVSVPTYLVLYGVLGTQVKEMKGGLKEGSQKVWGGGGAS